MTKNEYGEAVIKWITITVLLAVSVFFIFLYKNIFYDNTEKGQTEQIPTVTETPEEEEEEEEEEETPSGPIITYSAFPRLPARSNGGDFFINSGGSANDRLKDVIDIGGFYYLIVETSSNGRDFKAERDNIAVAKLSYDGTLTSTVTLSSTRNEYYMASKIMNNGMLIAAKGAGGITYYAVSFDLTYSKTVTSDSFSEMQMFYTRDYIFIAGAKDRNLILTAFDDGLSRVFNNSVEFEGNISILEIFPSMYGFSVAVSVNTDTPCAYMASVNSGGELLSRSLISSSRVLKISPNASGFTLLERSGQSIYLKAINNSYVQQFRTMIGEGTGGDFYLLANGYITFIYSNSGTVSKHLCRFGDIITVNDRDFQDIVAIKSFAVTSIGIYFYADVASHGGTLDTRVVNYTKNNLVTYSNIIGGYYQESAVKIVIKDNMLITFMTSHSNNANFMGNYGGADIFVMGYNLFA